MKTTADYGKSTRRNRTRERTPEGNGHAQVSLTLDAPTCCCSSCGRPLAEAAEAVQEHDRFLKWLFDRQEEFTESLATAIHDGLAQQLVSALLHLQGFQHLQDSPTNDAKQSFQTGLKLLQDSIRQAGRIAGQLRPLKCDDHAVTLGIESLVCEAQRLGGPEIVFHVRGEVGRLPSKLEGAVFRIVRELLTNACRHSGSEEVRLQAARTKDHLRLEIRDWGIGFDLTKVNGKAFGLREVRQRTGRWAAR